MLQFLILILIWCRYLVQSQFAESPCPDILKYTEKGENRWSGEITLSSEFSLSELWLHIVFDKEIQFIESTFKVATNRKNQHFILYKSFFLQSNVQLIIPFTVIYLDKTETPVIEEILLNGRRVCPTPTKTQLVSPCPSVFLYDDDEEPDRWYGRLFIRSDIDLYGVWIELVLDSPAELVAIKSADIKTKDNKSFLIYYRHYTLTTENILEIPFFVKYSILFARPEVKSVELNSRTICGSPKVTEINKRIDTDFNNDFSKSIIRLPEYNDDIQVNNPSSQYSCGIREIRDKVHGGRITSINKYPWHGAIFNGQYICGMSLLSQYHALSAAHCFYNKFKQQSDITTFDLYFGLSDIEQTNKSTVQRVKIGDLKLYPEYVFHEPEFDIALIKFDKPVEFNEVTIPICLPQQNEDIRNIEYKTGVVAGFGLTMEKVLSKKLRTADLLIVDKETCRALDQTFYVRLTNNSFCAGNLTESVVCLGDSGGGMYLRQPGTDIWQVRGIVSTSRDICTTHYYGIFTDVARYTNWIEEEMKK